MIPEPDEAEVDFLTPAIMFARAGTVTRSNYKRTWQGNNYRIKCGRYKDKQLTDIVDAKWLTWALNKWHDELPEGLRRALIDQFNSFIS